MSSRLQVSAATLPHSSYKDMLTYRVLVLSNTLGKGAMRFYGEALSVTLAEWRLITALARNGPITVNALSVEMSTDKGAISRTAASLVKKGYVRTRAVQDDARKVLLDLSSAGRSVYGDTIPLAWQRHESLVSVLTLEERTVLDRALAKLQERATELLGE